jgi:Family of unknown function (DUF6460)
MEHIFGGNPLAVVVRLVVLSLIVGIVLSAVGIHPLELFSGVKQLVLRVWSMGFDAFNWAGKFILLGAVVVVPIWALLRLFGVIRGRGEEARKPGRRG